MQWKSAELLPYVKKKKVLAFQDVDSSFSESWTNYHLSVIWKKIKQLVD